MSVAWHKDSGETPPPPRIAVLGWCLIALRVLLLGGWLGICLMLFALARLLRHSAMAERVVQATFQGALKIMRMPLRLHGTPMPHHGAVVANHTSWLDIFVLHAAQRVTFVSKNEVAGWPLLGFLARISGTVFIERARRSVSTQRNIVQERLEAGDRLLFFPEGTTTDGLRVIPFKTPLFEAFFSDALREEIWVQPVSVVYHPPVGKPEDFYGWWGDATLIPSLLSCLSLWRNGIVDVRFHAPLRVADYASRKPLALDCEEAVRTGHAELRASP